MRDAKAATRRGDLLDPASLAGTVKDVSAILHFAAVLRTPEQETIWKTNLEGTCNLIAATKRHSPRARFIMASTGLVYDARGPRPARKDDAVDPTTPYPANKVAAENALRSSGLSWSVLRLGFVYGDKDGHLDSVPKLAEMFKWRPANRLSMRRLHTLGGASSMGHSLVALASVHALRRFIRLHAKARSNRF